MQIAKRGEFFKAEGKLVYGWALVCEERVDGAWRPYIDTQGDHIPEDVALEAALEFAKNSRVGKDMHTGEQVGSVPMVFMITRGSSALGIESTKTGMLIGWEPSDPALLAAVASGERTGFSIGGEIESAEDAVIKAFIAAASPAVMDAMAAPFAKSVDDAPKVGLRARVFRRFRIDEISLVDRPAMEGATIAYVKRDARNSTPATPARKVSPMDEDAYKAKIAELETKLAEMTPAAKVDEVAPVLDPEKAGLVEVDMTPEQMMARIVELEGMLAEKSKPAEDVAKAADPVTYTTDDGQVLRKSAGPLVVKYAQEADLAKRALVSTELRKRAVEAIPCTKGADDVKVQLFAAAEKIGVDAVAILKASEALWAEAGKAKGAGGEGQPTTAITKGAAFGSLEQGLVAFCKANTITQVWTEGLAAYVKTDEGRARKAAYDSAK